MGYDEPDSALELFSAAAPAPAADSVHSGPDPSTHRFLHAYFALALLAALPQDPEMGWRPRHGRPGAFGRCRFLGCRQRDEGSSFLPFAGLAVIQPWLACGSTLHPLCWRVAPPGLNRASRHATRRSFRSLQDASISAPLGLVAWPACHCRGVHPILPHLPTRRSLPSATRRPAPHADAPRRLHQPRLH